MPYIWPTAAKYSIIAEDGGHPKSPGLIEAALPRWRATDTCYRMKARDCALLVTALTRLPTSAKKSRASPPMAPAVSTTTATKWCVRAKSRYGTLLSSSSPPMLL